ncbi:grasp-with-spasm system SPASM domain peptide maturase [Chryseobacterium fluminis]|uniref:grasp-with-spasm system SPASM domain peptide maturase n=1 Tax=Chryseobacterium fluminis TaxID=2983606 RepID=UPI0022512DA0|nr:grasp-with-spasm system SPASM domain peptide maturase [Chryseobacterium sp. MMS21-Ot14]UZT97758.1 grasp-with-spasm system SPASM domain peptide maturase [Chryseobacterium sp. MMS21-Ot14]
MTKYFELFQDCFIVKGAKNILLCDFHFNKIINVTGVYEAFVDDYYFPVEDHLSETITFLIAEKFGIITESITPKKFRKKFKWRSPTKINELIIELTSEQYFKLYRVYDLIEDLMVSFIQIRFLEFSFSRLEETVSLMEHSCIRTAELMLPYSGTPRNKMVSNLLKENPRIKIIYFYNAPENRSVVDDDNLFTIIYCKKNLTDPRFCGVVGEEYFLNDIRNISKSLSVNNCLYGKLFISFDGYLKNCPSSQKVLDHIDQISVQELISKVCKEKERYIKKDQVEVCRCCEYRYFCTDCRMYRENPSNIFSKPLKCGYDPYHGIWEEWSVNPLKSKAIQYYDLANIN